MSDNSADKGLPPRCECGHWWVDHDGYGCLIVSECECTRSYLAARDTTVTASESGQA